jgi:hypothetical protein
MLSWAGEARIVELIARGYSEGYSKYILGIHPNINHFKLCSIGTLNLLNSGWKKHWKASYSERISFYRKG